MTDKEMLEKFKKLSVGNRFAFVILIEAMTRRRRIPAMPLEIDFKLDDADIKDTRDGLKRLGEISSEFSDDCWAIFNEWLANKNAASGVAAPKTAKA